MGHLMRCLVFADYILEKGVNSVFITKKNSAKEKVYFKGFKYFIVSENKEDEVNEVIKIKDYYKSKVMLLDVNYGSTNSQRDEYLAYLKALKNLNFYLITFEELSYNVFPADIVIIPYVGAESLRINKKVGSQYLLGPKFFPVCKDYFIVTNKRAPKNVKNILITMGGSDPNQITIKVLKALSKLKNNVHLIVVLGRYSQIKDKQVGVLLDNYDGTFKVVKDVQNMAELMNESELAITNSGLTKYEMAKMGLPAIVISNNGKHTELMDDFSTYDTVVHIGANGEITEATILDAVSALAKDEIKREKMSNAGKQLVDGNGIERIFNCIPEELIYA